MTVKRQRDEKTHKEINKQPQRDKHTHTVYKEMKKRQRQQTTTKRRKVTTKRQKRQQRDAK